MTDWKPKTAMPIEPNVMWHPSSAIPLNRTKQDALTSNWQPKSAIPVISPQDPEATLGQATDFFRPVHPAFEVAGKGAELVEKGVGLGKEGMFNTLGMVGYPFKSMKHTIATPMTPLIKATSTIASGRKAEVPEELLAEVIPLYKSVPSELWTGLTSWGHLYETPEGAKNFNDVAGAYWEGLTGEKPPNWWKKAVGTGLEFATVPLAVSKLFKAFGATYNALPWVQRNQKQRQLWHRLLTRARGRTEGRIEAANELAKSIGKRETTIIAKELSYKTGTKITPQAVQKRLTQIISGSVTTQKSLTTKANPIIDEFRSNYKILQNYGIIGKETLYTKLPKRRIAELLQKQTKLKSQLTKLQTRKFPGRADKIRKLQGQIDDIQSKIRASEHLGGKEYFPRMYLEKETAGRLRLPFGRKRIRAPYAKKRQDIPFEVRKQMGEIKTAPYPVRKRLIQEAADIETAKLFKQVERIGLSSKVPKGNWKQLPEGKPYGALSKNFVPPRVYDDITAMAQIKTNFGQMYDMLIGNWKASKVLWNPPTHFRNMLSNSILLDLSGMNHASQLKYLKRASQEIIKTSKEYEFARRMFARTTLSRGELMDDMLQMTKATEGKGGSFQKILNAANRGSKKASKVPANIYAREEFIGKFMKYLEQRSTGKSPMAAVEEANKWLFDYSDLAGLEKTVARRIMPFYTFPRKAIPRVAEAITERPYTFAKYPLLASSMTKYSLSKLEISDKDFEEIKKVLPEYMQRGSYVLMPYRDKNGDLRFFDWTYIIPWGPINELQERGALGFFITNPIVQIFGDIQRNKDSFRGKKIWNDSIPESQWTPEYRKEQNYKKFEYAWKTLMPSLTPEVKTPWGPIKGIYWDKLREAALGISPKMGKKRPLPETIAHTIFGLRTQPIDVEESQRWRIYEKRTGIEELREQMRDAAIREGIGNITKKELDRRLKIYMNQAQKIGQQ